MFKKHTNPIVKTELYKCLELYVLTSILYILVASCVGDQDKITYNCIYIVVSTIINAIYVFLLYYYQINIKNRKLIQITQFILSSTIVFSLYLIIQFNKTWIQNNLSMLQVVVSFIYQILCLILTTVCYFNLKKFSYQPTSDEDDNNTTVYSEI